MAPTIVLFAPEGLDDIDQVYLEGWSCLFANILRLTVSPISSEIGGDYTLNVASGSRQFSSSP